MATFSGHRTVVRKTASGSSGALPVIPELILIVPFSAATWNFMESKTWSAPYIYGVFDCSLA